MTVTFQTERRIDSDRVRRDDVERLLATLDRFGLPAALPDVRVLVARAEQIDQARRPAEKATEIAIDRLERQIAAPDGGDVAALLREIVDLRQQQTDAATVSSSTARAVGLAWAAAGDAVAAHGEELLTDVLRPVFDRLVAEATRLAAKVPADVDSDRAALAAGVGKEWERLRIIASDLDALHDAADHLRTAQVIPLGLVHGQSFAPLDLRYRLPALLGVSALGTSRHGSTILAAARAIDWSAHPSAWLRDAIIGGAAPAMLTAADVVALRDERQDVVLAQRREIAETLAADGQPNELAYLPAARRRSEPVDAA